MGTFYYLSSCDTCKRIVKSLNLPEEIQLVDIKATPLTETQIDALYAQSGRYEALVNKRAQLYKAQKLKDKTLSEMDYRNLLLEHYTFLKRPVLQLKDRLFIGNSASTVNEIKDYLGE